MQLSKSSLNVSVTISIFYGAWYRMTSHSSTNFIHGCMFIGRLSMSAQFIPHNLELRWDVSSHHSKLSFLCVFIPDKPDLSVVCTRGRTNWLLNRKNGLWPMIWWLIVSIDRNSFVEKEAHCIWVHSTLSRDKQSLLFHWMGFCVCVNCKCAWDVHSTLLNLFLHH